MKAIRQRSGRGRRRRPATSASTRWRKCLHLRGKKQTPPSPSFVDDDSDSDSDEEEEDYQLIIKHDWAAITYLDVRSFQLWLPSTTEVRNRPVWVRWRHEIFAHYHDRRPSRLPHAPTAFIYVCVANTCAKHSNHQILTQMLLRDLLLGIQMDTSSWVVHHHFVPQGGVIVRWWYTCDDKIRGIGCF